MQRQSSYKVHLNTVSNGELSDPLCDSVNRGLTFVRLHDDMLVNRPVRFGNWQKIHFRSQQRHMWSETGTITLGRDWIWTFLHIHKMSGLWMGSSYKSLNMF